MVLMRHKNLSSTELNVGSIRGRVMPGAALAKVRELAKEREREAAERLSRGVTKPEAGNTTTGTFGQQNRVVEGSREPKRKCRAHRPLVSQANGD
ncbi:hypothetical protein QEG98_31490 [Myxococcus sp. MxC21-1]|uniref:hypothetical protein n=1 Tax=Myxococcus sp. MxC21-1 TaxID=3041439 RepID=UPI00292DC523|nr:hypothetical protein [Myxococcus sp. MxC21-1]WNZ60469.1 hypothetical protein QEG98_31490 [Myxococcus sp. MxC21-1]